MTTPELSDDLERPRAPGNAAKIAATAAIGVVLVIGAYAVGKGNSSTTTAAAGPAGAGMVQNGMPQGGATTGGGPPGGFGTPVSGSTLTKLSQLVTAEYPGTVERAMTLPDGSYAVHVIQKSGGEVHVLVSKAMQITGTETGGPPQGFGDRDQDGGQAPPTQGSGASS